jgi:hypothetical protein
MNPDLIIAQANEAARNPYSSAHMNAAVARLIAFLIENKAPAFVMFPSPDSFTDAREFLESLAMLADDIALNAARDAEIEPKLTIFSDALHDSGLPGDLTEAGERLAEDARERALENA